MIKEVYKKPKQGKFSDEIIRNFICPCCEKWWSIASPDLQRHIYTCPWCSEKAVYNINLGDKK